MSSVAGLRRPPSFDRGVQARSAASALGAVAMALAGLAAAWSLDGRMAPASLSLAIPPTEPLLGFLLDPTPTFTATEGSHALSGFRSVPVAVAVASVAAEARMTDAVPQQEQAAPVPFPPPRPLALAPVAPLRLAALGPPGPIGSEPSAAVGRSLFEPLFGLKRPAVAIAEATSAVTGPATLEGPIAILPEETATALVPFPPPRPLALAPAEPPARARFAERSRPGRARGGPQAAPADNRGFFERLFGLNQPAASGPAMAYAPAETPVLGRSLGLSSSMPVGGGGTAVYDIAAHTVTLPDGTRLEAHSGLGQHLDDPGGVHLRMRGATPPHTYQLSLREKLFHGVRALRLTPVGDGHIFGRDGLLAHTYMLGPNGQSNGCVSFRDYRAFLAAFERGDVRRLVVVGRS